MNEKNNFSTMPDDPSVRHNGGPPTQSCSTCQASVDAGAKFCCQCGSRISDPAAAEPAPEPKSLQEATAPPEPPGSPVQVDATSEQTVDEVTERLKAARSQS